MGLVKGVGLSKQLSITLSDEIWDKVDKDIKRVQCKYVSKYIEKALTYYLDRNKHKELLKEAQKEAIMNFMD